MASSVKIGANVDSPLFSFDDDSITDMVVDTAVNLIMDEITADTAEITVIYEAADRALLQLDWATPVYIYSDNVLTGKFFSKLVTRTGAQTYKIECTSVIGLLEYETYYGKVFSGETFKEAVEAIILTNGITEDRGITKTVQMHSKDSSDPYYGPYRVRASVGTSALNPFLYALMECNLTLNRSLLSEVYVESLADKTRCRDVLAGACFNPDITHAHPDYFTYGLYMDMSRASVNDPWPEYGEVFFEYYTLKISLGTPTEPTTYDIYCDPKNRLVTINGTNYTLPYPINDSVRTYTQSIGTIPLRNAFGGMMANGTNYSDAALPHDVIYRKWRISRISNITVSGSTPNAMVYIPSDAYYNPYVDAYAVLGVDGGVYVGDSISVERRDGAITNADIIPSEFTAFQTVTTYQEDIVNSIQYAPGIDSLAIYGWLPILSKREALHQLMFSQGVMLRKDANGNLLFSAPTTDYFSEISDDKIYESGSESYLEHTNLIKITEHEFRNVTGKAAETIYTTEIPTTSDFVIVPYSSAPIVGNPTTSGLSVYASNCNAAIVGGVGSLNGVTYEHTQSIITRIVGDYVDGRELSVTDATLVTFLNSGNVMDRLASYYANSFMISNAIVLGNERTGNYYKFTSPFGDIAYGFLKKIHRVFSSIVKGNCEFLCNYSPATVGLGYQHFVVLTGTGTWEVPESVFQKTTPRIRAVLIAGGDGGASGTAGENGQITPVGWVSTNSPAKGGQRGANGDGGKIYEVTIENPAYSYNYSAGLGGSGGGICTSKTTSNSGLVGDNSSISDGQNSYSSYLGAKSEYGIVNFFTGDVYAKSPSDGPYTRAFTLTPPSYVEPTSGGGGGVIYIKDDSTDNPVNVGGGAGALLYETGLVLIGSYLGGLRGENSPKGASHIVASGGCGGGAAAGQNGGKGGDASGSRAGNGGKGGDATLVPPMPLEHNPIYYGYGGFGGYGGGGGGASGAAVAGGSTGTPGIGGYGGKGGVGADGCILIYY